MSLSNDRQRVFKRLETDAEFRKRCCTKWCYSDGIGSDLLDNHIEFVHDAQRRIVEDTTDKPR